MRVEEAVAVEGSLPGGLKPAEDDGFRVSVFESAITIRPVKTSSG